MAGGYPELVAPIVPDAQRNKSSEIALEGMRTGLAAAAQINQMRRKSEMDMMELAARERLANEEHDLQKQKLDMAAEMMPYQRRLSDAHADYYKAHAKAYTDGTATAAQRAIAFNQQRQELITDVNDQATRLQLDDPNFATKEPVKYAANVLQFEDMFKLSPLPEVKNAITQYRRTADEQKIPIKLGATWDSVAEKWEGGSEAKPVPIWQIVKNLQNPNTQEETMNALQASGHTKIIEDFTMSNKGKKSGTRRMEMAPSVKSYLEKGKDVKFERAKSRVPSAMLPKSAAGGTEPTELPEPDLPPIEEPDPQASLNRQPKFEATPADKALAQAKAAIVGGAPFPQVAQLLQEMGGDPSQLVAS